MNYSMALTVPEEDRENYITEVEAKEIITGFNLHLKSLSVQVDELAKHNSTINAKFEKEIQRNDTLRASISQTKQSISEIEALTKEKASQLLKLEDQFHTESLRSVASCNTNITELEVKIQSSSTQESIDKQIHDLIDYLTHLESASVVLETQQELLKQKIIEKNESFRTEIKCVNCREKYTLSKNFNNSCRYHPGKLKYFSCRSCGGDAFYDCCLKCKDCIKGCKVTHHTS